MALSVAFASKMRQDEAARSSLDITPADRRYINGMISLYEGDYFLSKLLLEAGRCFVFRAIVSRHAGFDALDRSTWPTLGSLQQDLQHLGFASPRRVHNMVARLIHTGFVTARSSAHDGRVKILSPTARMLAHHQALMDVLAEAIAADHVSPRPHLPGDVASHRDVLRAAQALNDNEPMLFFLQREAGIVILLTLIRRGADDDPRPLCFSEIGKAFGVSRTHVRHMLHAAADLGYLTRTSGDLNVSSPMKAAFDRFLAQEMTIVTGGDSLPLAVGTAA